MKKFALIALALFAGASLAMASAVAQFKAGDISFSVLDKDAVTPLSSASIKLLSSESGDVVAEATADELGKAVVSVDEGRYLLNVSDINLAIFDVSSVEGLSACRVIMPDEALLVGGKSADDESGAAVGVGGGWLLPAAGIIAAAAVIGGAAAVIDHNSGHSHHGDKETSTPPSTPAVHKKSTPKSHPSKI